MKKLYVGNLAFSATEKEIRDLFGQYGSVSSVSVSNSSLSNPRVEGCITRQFGRLQFPAADKPTNASFPFVFRPSKK